MSGQANGYLADDEPVDDDFDDISDHWALRRLNVLYLVAQPEEAIVLAASPGRNRTAFRRCHPGLAVRRQAGS